MQQVTQQIFVCIILEIILDIIFMASSFLRHRGASF